jgi:putative ABC transport system ATP-binding protein
LFDLLPPQRLLAALRMLKAHGTTVILCTGRPEDLALDGFLHLGMTQQRRFDALADLQAANRQGDDDAATI